MFPGPANKELDYSIGTHKGNVYICTPWATALINLLLCGSLFMGCSSSPESAPGGDFHRLQPPSGQICLLHCGLLHGLLHGDLLCCVAQQFFSLSLICFHKGTTNTAHWLGSGQRLVPSGAIW